MSIKLSPSEFADKYLSLPVYIYPPEGKIDNTAMAQTGWQTVRCANYRLGASSLRDTLWEDIKAHMPAMVDFKLRTIEGDEISDTMSSASLGQHFKQSFVGKGSPEQAQIVIQLVYRFHKVKTTLEDFVGKNFIGLDCNGFVGNYLQRVIQGVDWDKQANDVDPGPNSWMENLMKAKSGKLEFVKNLSDMDVNGGYILVMANPDSGQWIEPTKATDTQLAGYGHVMLTQPGTLKTNKDGSVNISVSEATAAGSSELRKDVDYKIYNKRIKGSGVLFTVDRGNTSDTLDVVIAGFPVS